MSAATTHYQQQLHYANVSRQSATPHYRARAAAAVARSSGLSAAVPITDPNSASKAVIGYGEGLDKAGLVEKDTQQQWRTLDLGGMGLKNVSRELFSYTFLTALYINHNNLHHLSPEISRLSKLTVLDASGNKLTSVPPELGLLTNLKELLLVDNGLMTLPPEMGTLYQLETLALEGNPLNDSLKNLLQQDGTGAVINYLRENCPVPLPPPEREWITLEDNDSTTTSLSQDTFTVFCNNILADPYATPQMYGYTPSWALTWEYRKELILQEILAYSADIVCLQEVESSQYEDYFKEQMKQQGDYDSVFWPKSRAKTMPEKDRRLVDGCATFFKASKFSLVDKHLIEFNHIALQRPDFRKTEDIFNRVMTKDNIAIVTLLEHKDTKTRVVVANAHTCWDPLFKDVKLVQVAMMTEELDKLSTQWAHLPASGSNVPPSSPTGKLPTLICGDYNSIPSSGVYEYLTKGTIAQGHEDFGDYAYGTYTSEGLSHKMTLKSAYGPEADLPFTNFTPAFTAVIDYIFYSSNFFSVLGLLGGVEKEYMSRVVGFPNAHFPSDHIPILAEFKFRTQATASKTAPNFGTTGSSNSSNHHGGRNNSYSNGHPK
ncbi:MAG: Endonuclease/exonuclease/phosphatase [Podila humilis]|nr:MAG: Endonuclease/exonuclease/phosphatase [Podila humilis]